MRGLSWPCREAWLAWVVNRPARKFHRQRAYPHCRWTPAIRDLSPTLDRGTPSVLLPTLSGGARHGRNQQKKAYPGRPGLG
jgi:hypothetical protein